MDAGNDDIRGIWSDGTTMYVADSGNDKFYAYKMSNKLRDSGKEFNLDSDNDNASGIWSDGRTMWVAQDVPDVKIFAYKLRGGQRDSAKDFSLLHASNNSNPVSIWSDGITMYVADDADDKVYAYNMLNKLRDSGKEFNIAGENDHPGGIWSDGHTMYVGDYSDLKVHLYNLRQPVWDSDITVQRYPTQVTGESKWLGYNDNRYGGKRRSLTDKTFTWKSKTYTVRWLSWSHRRVRLGFTSGNSGNDAKILKALRDNVAFDNLIIKDNRYRVADATGVYSGTNHPGFTRHFNQFKDGAYKGFVEVGWTNQDAPWKDGDTVSVKLLDAEPGSTFWEGDTTVLGHHEAGFTNNPFNRGGNTWEFKGAYYRKNGSDHWFDLDITSGDWNKDRAAKNVGRFHEFDTVEVRWWDEDLRSREVTLRLRDTEYITHKHEVAFVWFSLDASTIPRLVPYQRFKVKLLQTGPPRPATLQTSSAIAVDLPTVSSVAITSDPGQDDTYAEGEDLELTATFSEPVNVTGSPQLALELGGQSETATYDRGSGTNKLVFTHTVGAGDQSDTIFVSPNAITLNDGTINSVAHGFAANLSHNGFAIANSHIIDGVSPTLQSAGVNGAALTLTYSEALDQNSDPPASAFSTTVAGATRAVNDVAMSGSQVTLTLASVVAQGETVTVSYTPPTGDAATPLRDLPGNAAPSFSGQAVTNSTGTSSQATLPPAISSLNITSEPGTGNFYAIGEGITFTATFDEAVTVTGRPKLAFSLNDAPKSAYAQAASSSTTVAFTYTVAQNDQGDTIVVSGDSITLNEGSIDSSSGDVAANLNHHGLAVANLHRVDGVSPSLSTAAVDGSTLTLTYGEALDGNSVPPATAFSTTVAGAARAVSGVSMSGNTVTLTLASAVTADDPVPVGYTQPTGDSATPLRDRVGRPRPTTRRQPPTRRLTRSRRRPTRSNPRSR